MPVKNDRPGAFELSDVFLISYANNELGQPNRLNIRNLITEFNIYESLDSKFLSGDMILTDATNVIHTLPLTGFERIEFFFRSPNTTVGYDFGVDKGHPMFVYNLKNRQAVSLNSQIYQLKFISLEGIRDHQTRISKAFSGNIEQMIADISNNFLKTKKNVLVEETKSNHKFVMPRIKPSTAIDQLCKVARSKNFENSGFVFYEDANAFHFKSYEGLFCKTNGTPREPVAHYSPKVKNILKKGDEGKTTYDLQAVESFKVLNQYNTLNNTAYGAYSSRLITHDLYNKTFNEFDFDYNVEYAKQNHLEQDAKGDKRDDNGILPFFNYDNGESFGMKHEGVLFLQSETAKVHNTHELPQSKDILQKRISQKLATNSLVLEITIPGFSEVRVGSVVTFTMPNFSRTSQEDKEAKDKYLSGRYLINAARHHVSALNKRHTMVLELVKDSFNINYPEEQYDLFTNNEADDGLLYSTSHLDETQ
jgi:hypothetical protein